MKLIEALNILREEPNANEHPLRLGLVCGFTPLHLQTFLAAEQRVQLSVRAHIQSGLYGDFLGNLQKLPDSGAEAAAVVVEWSDLDARLGLRGLGSWAPHRLPDILSQAKRNAHSIGQALAAAATMMPLVISFPTLPLLPVSFQKNSQANEFELELRGIIGSMALSASRVPSVRVVSSQALDQVSNPAQRLDAKAELVSGFPYQLQHASALANSMVHLMQPPSPKKGLITDLDDTMWSGIVGEVGAENISWDLQQHSHGHALYQRFLQALGEAGVLLGVASKNDPQVIATALQRSDLLVARESLYPVEAHWGPKSESVRRILQTWNFGAADSVFIDDSPMELAEVKAAHPEIECILFPKDDPQALVALMFRLRDLFGKNTISEEDLLRRDSIRRSHRHRDEGGHQQSHAPESFLEDAEPEITFLSTKNPPDPRALELVNKTNQFNLNGRRYTEAEWRSYLTQPEAFLLMVSYRDKFGPLGKIAVAAGKQEGRLLRMDVWVMSCRAFSRRIEHRTLAYLFETFSADAIAFDFAATEKNGPLRAFLMEVTGTAPAAGALILREQFSANATESQPTIESVRG